MVRFYYIDTTHWCNRYTFPGLYSGYVNTYKTKRTQKKNVNCCMRYTGVYSWENLYHVSIYVYITLLNFLYFCLLYVTVEFVLPGKVYLFGGIYDIVLATSCLITSHVYTLFVAGWCYTLPVAVHVHV